MKSTTIRRLSINLSMLLTSTLLTISVSGCSEDSEQSSDEPVLGIDTGGGGGGGGGGADAGSGVDANPSAALRTLTTSSLLGDTPVRNHIVDPLFTAFDDGRTWIVTTPTGDRLVPARRRVEPISPADTPMLEVPLRQGGGSAMVSGTLRLTAAPLEVSTWVGVPAGEDVTALGLSVRVFGMAIDDPTKISGSALELASTEQTHGTTWFHYRGVVSGFAGYGMLSVATVGAGAFAVHAPVAVPLEQPANALIALEELVAPREAASTDERLALESIGERMRQPDDAPRRRPSSMRRRLVDR